MERGARILVRPPTLPHLLPQTGSRTSDGGQRSLQCPGLPGPPSLTSCSCGSPRGDGCAAARVHVCTCVCVGLQVSACVCARVCTEGLCVFLCPSDPHVVALCPCVQMLCVCMCSARVDVLVRVHIYSLCACVCAELGTGEQLPSPQALEVRWVKSQGPEVSDLKPPIPMPTSITELCKGREGSCLNPRLKRPLTFC